MLISAGIRVLVVFDGGALPAKANEADERRRVAQLLLLLLQELRSPLIQDRLVTETGLRRGLAPLRLWALLNNIISLDRALVLIVIIVGLGHLCVPLDRLLPARFS